jgi:hypothetical protein
MGTLLYVRPALADYAEQLIKYFSDPRWLGSSVIPASGFGDGAESLVFRADLRGLDGGEHLPTHLQQPVITVTQDAACADAVRQQPQRLSYLYHGHNGSAGEHYAWLHHPFALSFISHTQSC